MTSRSLLSDSFPDPPPPSAAPPPLLLVEAVAASPPDESPPALLEPPGVVAVVGPGQVTNSPDNVTTLCFFYSWLQTKCRVSFDITVSDAVLYALSHGTLRCALHGSFANHFLIG